MDADNHRSTSVPIAVSLRSEQEESKSEGTYTELDDGFTLEFALGDGSYNVSFRDGKTSLTVGGVLSYFIDFSKVGRVELSTPFGVISYTVVPKKAEVKKDDVGINLELCYALEDGAERIERAVNINAAFLK